MPHFKSVKNIVEKGDSAHNESCHIIENIVAKGEIAHDEQFHLLHQFFQLDLKVMQS